MIIVKNDIMFISKLLRKYYEDIFVNVEVICNLQVDERFGFSLFFFELGIDGKCGMVQFLYVLFEIELINYL